MLLAIEITLNVIWIPVVCIAAAIAGYSFRSSQISKIRSQLQAIEKEMLENHAEILALQKENVELQEKVKNSSAPVISITPKENSETLPDTAARKKLFGKSSANQHT